MNDGQPVQLNFFPALPPKPIHDANGELQGLLLCEEVAKANSNNSVAPLTRFSFYSSKSGSRTWSYDADCAPSILGFAPDWPIVADLTGDSDPEILIVDGGDLEVPGYKGPTCLSSLQLLNSKTGKPLWDSDQLAQIRCQDRQIQNVVVGPDAGGDNKPDVYAVTSMINEKVWIYVDVLDGNDGTRIKAFHADVPMFSNGKGLDLETPLLIGDPNSRDQRLVVSTKFIEMVDERASTVVMSLETGEILNFADQLEHPLLADGDGDGHKDVFLVKPKSRDRIDLSGQFVSLKAVAGVGVSLTGSHFVEIGDVNGDGVHDLIEDAGAGKIWHTKSGVDGKLIYVLEPLSHGQAVHPLNADVDSDGVDDFVMESSDHNFQMTSTVSYLLISGKTGRRLWEAKFLASQFGAKPVFLCHDLDGDGAIEILVVHREILQPGSQSRVLTCLDRSTGQKNWSASLEVGGAYTSTTVLPDHAINLRIADVNNDGVLDIVCPVFGNSSGVGVGMFNGRDGQRVCFVRPDKKSRYGNETLYHELFPKGPDSEAKLVRVEGILHTWSRLHFFQVTDGRPISNIELPGRVLPSSPTAEQRPLATGSPFIASFGGRSFVGVSIQAEKSEQMIVLVDPGDREPEIFQRIRPKEFYRKSGSWRNNDLLDVYNNAVGNTVAILYAGDDVVTVELGSNKELARKTIPGVTGILHDKESGWIKLVTDSDQDKRIKLLRPDTLEVVWDLNYPRHAKLESLSSLGIAMDDKSRPFPRALFREHGDDNSVFFAVATAAEFRGQEVPGKASVEHPEKPQLRDPRLCVSFPWNTSDFGSSKDRVMTMVTEDIPVALGTIIFPVFFLLTMLRRKQWNLQWFLMLPLLFIVPWITLRLPYTCLLYTSPSPRDS